MIDDLLRRVQKPGRYIGKEKNAVYKEIKNDTVRYLISYPDVYEIGMSNTGIRILYHILNKIDGVYCERTFAPWPDMVEEMKKSNVPLFSLETYTPAKEFDIWSFTLEYDLCLTNVALMLDLAGVPFFSEERKENDPVIFAGGTLTYNPFPFERMFDVIAFGEGEELLPYIMQITKEWKKGKISREEFLAELSKHESLYVPQIGDRKNKRKAVIEELKEEYVPVKDIVPNIDIVHGRMTIEIMRGCTRSCRFCQAGNVYKPLRLRDADTVLRIAKKMYENMGMEEISLLSLSSSDYPYLYELIDKLMVFFNDKYVNISLPSLRGDALNEDLAQRLSLIRKSSLTFAPEGGADRLRRIVNKDIKEEDIFNSIEIAKKYGWKHVKLYYMIGLPGETDADIEGIIEMVKEIKKKTGIKNIKVSVSPFVPRPFTPFEKVKQASMDYIKEKNDYIKAEFSKIKGVDVSLRDEKISYLEGVFARGGDLSEVIVEAYKRGAKFDEWREFFRFDIWDSVFNDMGVDVEAIHSGENNPNWHFIKLPVLSSFYDWEYQKSRRGEMTIDCRYDSCYGCGACNLEIVGQMKDIKIPPMPEITTQKRERSGFYRLKFEKMYKSKYLSYLDIMRLFFNALRLTNFPVLFTHGFNPKMKISFSSPLPLGIESMCEYVDIEVYEEADPLMLNKYLIEGIKINDFKFIKNIKNSLQSLKLYHLYVFNRLPDIKNWQVFLKDGIVEKVSKKGKKREIYLKDCVESVYEKEEKLFIEIKGYDGCPGINVIKDYLYSNDVEIIKKDMYLKNGKQKIDIMDLEE